MRDKSPQGLTKVSSERNPPFDQLKSKKQSSLDQFFVIFVRSKIIGNQNSAERNA